MPSRRLGRFPLKQKKSVSLKDAILRVCVDQRRFEKPVEISARDHCQVTLGVGNWATATEGKSLNRRPSKGLDSTWVDPKVTVASPRRCLIFLQSRINFLGRKRQVIQPHADGVFDRIGDSGRCWNVGNFSDRLALIRSWAGGVFH